MADTIDSNVTGTRIAEEASPGVLPGTPIWYPAEPNSYDDFGSDVTTKARTPINQNRQRKKGSPVDLDAAGGYSQDFTETGLLRQLQGFLFADAHIPGDTKPIDGSAAVVITSVANVDSSLNAASGLDIFATDDIVLLSGYAIASNNGVKTVASALAGKVTLDQSLVDEAAPPVSARIEKIGVQTTDLSVVVTGSQITLHTAGAIDFTTLGLVTGSWIFVGSDAAAFAAAGNQCFARVDAITATDLSLGKTTKQMVTEAATAVDIILPTFIRNEPDPANIKKRSYQLERKLGSDANGVMSEYLVNAFPNEFMFNVPTADLLTADLKYLAGDNEQRTGLVGPKSGTRPTILAEDAYNTSSDVQRLRLSIVDVTNPFPAALFGYASEAKITINNNGKPNKAIGVLGAFSIGAGSFDVGGSAEVYFATIEAVQAVRNNADVTLDLIFVKNSAGWVFDIPLLSLSGGQLNVAANEPIKLPLETNAAESDQGHTFMAARFSHVPDIA